MFYQHKVSTKWSLRDWNIMWIQREELDFFTFVFWRMWWGLSLFGMTAMPCCTWYLNSTCENILLLMLGYTRIHTHTHKIHTCTDLSRALLVLLSYLRYHWVLQKLARISVTSKSKDKQGRMFLFIYLYQVSPLVHHIYTAHCLSLSFLSLLITSNITTVFLALLVCLFFGIFSVVLPF